MKSLLSKIGIGLFIAFWLFLGLKGCVSSIYSANEIAVYEDISEYGESNKIYIIPSNYVVLKKQYQDLFEYSVYYVKGSDATHYFGPFYNSGENILGLRMYSDANEVWKTEMKMIDKQGNIAESTFQEIGETFRSILIFRDNSMEFGNYEYKKLEPTPSDLKFIEQIKATLYK